MNLNKYLNYLQEDSPELRKRKAIFKQIGILGRKKQLCARRGDVEKCQAYFQQKIDELKGVLDQL